MAWLTEAEFSYRMDVASGHYPLIRDWEKAVPRLRLSPRILAAVRAAMRERAQTPQLPEVLWCRPVSARVAGRV